MADNILQEFGIFSPPAALPNPADLSNGQHGANLRYGKLDLATDEGKRRFLQVLGWFKTFEAPVDDYTFYVPVNASGDGSPGYGSTQIIFADAQGRRCVFDATQMLNAPESHLTALLLTFGLPVRPGALTFPGFDVIDQQATDPVGEPLPALNTPGWRRPFARYYGVSSAFSAAEHPLGSRFLRIAADEEFMRTDKIFGWKPNPAGFGMLVAVRPVWERVR